MKAINVAEAIELAKKKRSLEGYAIQDLGTTQVSAVDALALADGGVLIPEQNVFYRDEDVAHDPEFDDYEWKQLPLGTTLEELSGMVEDTGGSKPAILNVEVEVEDQKALRWANENHTVLKNILQGVVRELYRARTLEG